MLQGSIRIRPGGVVVQDVDHSAEPPAFSPSRRRLNAGRLILESVSLIDQGFAAAWPVWLALAAVMIATDLVILVYGADRGVSLTSAQTLAFAARTFALLLVFVMGLRITALGRARVRFDRDFWSGVGRMALIQFPLLVAAGLLLRLAAAVAMSLSHDEHATRTAVFWALTAVVVAIIPIEVKTSLWPTAALAGERGLSLASAWKRSRGTTWSAVIAWLVLVLPFMLVHFALAAWIEQATAPEAVRVALTVVDCLVSVVETGLMIGVMAALYVLTREPI
jgi:hypothetical protein